jgi:6-phosphogluconolactonase (cycloisomerase 2 family)
MRLSRIGRFSLALAVSVALGLGMTACGGGTIGYIWVLGAQYNQIGGFKVDNFSGNLTSVLRSPFSSNGTNPVSLVIKPGGRYLYVVNKGNSTTSGNISLFSVGGDGVLTFQQSYTSRGSSPVWAQIDATGGFLYVLDTLYPDTPTYPNPNGLGDITVFSIDNSTGRLQLVPNQQIRDSNQTQLTFFPVGPNPTMMRVSNGCMFTINSGNQTVFPYSIGTSGQLTLTANSSISTGAGNLTSISTSGTYVYLTDAAATADSAGGRILPYTVTASTCALNTLTGGAVNNLALTSNPVNTFADNRARSLYVLNRSSTDPNNRASSISAYTIDSTNGRLAPLGTGGSASAGNPYAVGSGPACMVEDTSNQYIYTANNIDSTITGFRIDSNSGELRNLTRGSTFPTVGQPTCLALSGNTN